MRIAHLLCPRERAFTLAHAFEQQFAASAHLLVAAAGLVANQPVGFVVLATTQSQFEDDLLLQWKSHPDVSGYSLFSLEDDDPFRMVQCDLYASWEG